MNTTKALGDRGEAAAAQYLRKRGCQLLASLIETTVSAGRSTQVSPPSSV